MAGYPPQQPPYPPAGYPPPPPGYGYPPPPGYAQQPQQPQQPAPSGGCCSPSCCLGCVVVMLIGLAVVGGIGYYMYVMTANLVGQGIRELAKEIAAEAPIADNQKDRVATKIEHFVNEMTRIDKIYGRITSGKFTEENLKRIYKKAMESPVVQGLMVEIARGRFLEESDLPEAEVKEAETTLRRVVEGLVTGKISQDQMKQVLDKISSTDSDGNRNFKGTLSDEDLKGFLESCKAVADNSGVQPNPPEVNLADEFDRLIDGILAEF